MVLSFTLYILLAIVTASANCGRGCPKRCYDVNIPVTVTSNNYIWGLPKFRNDFDVGNFVTEVTRRDAATSFIPFSGISPETASYSISGTFCQPATGGAGTVLVASHGLLMDRYYWDTQYKPSTYSFVDFAISNGYSIFYYDRLGAGRSSRVSGYVNQAPLQLAILEKLTAAVKSGSLSGVPKFTPKKLVLLGHSFGSFLNAGLMSLDPNVADGAIMTGMSYYGGLPQGGLVLATLQGRIASGQNPWRFKGYDSGYTYCVDVNACANAFYKDPYFEPAAATYLYNNGWPSAAMEQMTILAINISTTAVTAPVMFFNGEYDFVECGGYCPGVIEPAARHAFPHSVGYESYIHPNTGHILTTATNATSGYQVIIDWLAKNSL